MNIREMLSEHIVRLEFEKSDGTTREMMATLKPEYLPETKGTDRKPNPDIVTVFDLGLNEWRSFREANLISASINE